MMEINKLTHQEVLNLTNDIIRYCILSNYYPYHFMKSRIDDLMNESNQKIFMDLIVYFNQKYYQLIYYGRNTIKYGRQLELVGFAVENDEVKYWRCLTYRNLAGYVYDQQFGYKFYVMPKKNCPSLWSIIDDEVIKFYIDENPKLKYMNFDRSMNLFDYIERYNINNKLELFSKLGLAYLARDKRFLNITDKKILKFIRDNAEKIKDNDQNAYFKKITYIDILAMVNNNISFDDYIRYIKSNQNNKYDGLKMSLLSHLKMKDKINYIKRFEEHNDFFNVLKDYQRLAKEFHIKELTPIKLYEEHDRLVAMKNEEIRLQLIEDNKLLKVKLKNENRKYKTKIKPYKKLILPSIDENAKIVLLDDIMEIKKDGDMLKHCVFTNKYYEKKSLLLSARDSKDNPIETIEIELKENPRILQARGYGNSASEYHSKILNAVEELLPMIKQIVIAEKVV